MLSRVRSRLAAVLFVAVVLLATPAVAGADMLPLPSQPPTAAPTTQTPLADTQEASPTAAPVATLPRRASTPLQPEDVFAALAQVVVLMLVPLVATVVLEVPIVVIAGRGSRRTWQVAVLVNALTNPVAVVVGLASAALFWSRYRVQIAALGMIEFGVIAVEAWAFTSVLGWSARKAFVVSLLANAVSFALGFVFLYGLPF